MSVVMVCKSPFDGRVHFARACFMGLRVCINIYVCVSFNCALCGAYGVELTVKLGRRGLLHFWRRKPYCCDVDVIGVFYFKGNGTKLYNSDWIYSLLFRLVVHGLLFTSPDLSHWVFFFYFFICSKKCQLIQRCY